MKKSLPKLDMKKFKGRCLAPIASFANLSGFVKTDTKDGILLYRDNGADILAVAHLDSVCDTNHFNVVTIKEEKCVLNAQLDDRLGVYLLLDYLPQLGIKYDILLTEGEEVGRSTAKWFETSKKYNWMFQFDRAGCDVVLYDYETDIVCEMLEAENWDVGVGSFSDICSLEHLGTVGINFGCGYQNNHSKMAYAFVGDILYDVKRFVKFYNRHAGTVLPLPEDFGQPKYYGKYNWRKYNWDDLVEDKFVEGQTRLDQHGDSWDKLDKANDFLSCMGCNLTTHVDELYFVDEDYYCADCVDAMQERYERRGRDKYALEFQSKPSRTCPICFNFMTDGYCQFCER